MHKTLTCNALALLTLTLSAWMAPAHAIDIAPYSAQTWAQQTRSAPLC